MAKNDIRSRTITFLAAQSAILSVIMLAFVALASVLFVKNSIRWQLNKIEQSLLMFAQQAAQAGEVPKRGDLGENSFFILSQDGKYILPRLPRPDDGGERLWQEYELKLIYEMQKSRDGWIYYPEQGHLGMSEGQYVIRYVFLEKHGWIIAAEGYIPGAWSMLKGFLTPKLFLGLFFIVCLAFALMLLNAFWHFRKMMKAILRSQENNFIVTPAQPRSQAEPIFMKTEDKSYSGGAIRNASNHVLPKMRSERAAPAAVDHGSAAELPAEEARPAVPLQVKKEHKEEPVFNPHRLDDLGDVTIDTAEIRSPLLKKVIQEMRSEKK